MADRFRISLEAIVRWVLVGMMSVMLGIILLSVFARYVLGQPITWGEEGTRFLLVWISFLGAGLATKYGKELAARELAMLLPAPLLRVVDGAIGLLSLAFLATFIVAGIGMLPVGHQTLSEILEVPYSLVYLAAPLGGALMAFYLVLRLRDTARRRPADKDASGR